MDKGVESMNTVLLCRGCRALAVLAVPFALGWATVTSHAAIPPTWNIQKVINNTYSDPAAIPPQVPIETPPVVSQPPAPQQPVVIQPPPVVIQPPPVVVPPPPVVKPPPVTTPPQVPVDTPPPRPAAVTPEPASLVMGLLGSGIAGMIALRRRRSRRVAE
jgi:hypothetical protein